MFDGKVVLVTGAGNGLGRAYALAFAERGASVVVNDLGGDHLGGGKGTRAADKVVDEIKAKGGKAVANYNSVEDGDKVVQTALDAFGRIDVVVNNAGILRDKSFARISDNDWDLIQRVHLRGSFMVTRAAWPHMKKNGFGRIIMVSSSSGIYGNFGQANYSAAKLGLAGLSNTLSLEGKKYNINCNCVAPIAGSRMTETVMPPDILAALKPEYVAPVVVFLCHDSCEETGGLFEVGAGWVGKLRWQRTEGKMLREINKPVTVESVRDNWSKITDFDDATIPSGNNGFLIEMGQKVDEDEKQEAELSKSSDPLARAKAFKPSPVKFSYTPRDVILYALGVGVSTAQEDHLKFTFELSEDFCVIPSFGVIPAFEAFNSKLIGGLPGFEIDPTKILHGEQYLELYKPLAPAGKLVSQLSVADIVDKKSGALIHYNIETYDDQGDKVCFNQFSTFVVGAGNFGGPKTTTKGYPLAETPKRAPDAVMQEKTSIDQAALYRLSGDRNPLHIDPQFAAMGGFKEPILHGLCSFGHSVRHVLKTYANNDMSKFKSVKVRFSKPVLPGQTIKTEMWKDGNRILFQTKVMETGVVCISSAYVELSEVVSASTAEPESSAGALRSNAVFAALSKGLKSQTDLVAKVNCIYQFNITQGGKKAATWTVDLKNKNGEIYEGPVNSGKADCTITVSDDDYMDMVAGKLDGQKAFMTGKIKLAGNMMLAQKLSQLFSLAAKM